MPEVKDKMTGKTIATMPYDSQGQMAAEKMVAENPGYEIKDGSMRSEQMYEGGGMTGMSMIGRPQYKEGGKMKYMHGGKMKKMGHGGMTPEMKKYEEGGKAMKPVDAEKNPGLSKLPKEVRNKMGYMKEGGKTKTYLEIMRENVAKQKANIKKGVSDFKVKGQSLQPKQKRQKQDQSYKSYNQLRKEASEKYKKDMAQYKKEMAAKKSKAKAKRKAKSKKVNI